MFFWASKSRSKHNKGTKKAGSVFPMRSAHLSLCPMSNWCRITWGVTKTLLIRCIEGLKSYPAIIINRDQDPCLNQSGFHGMSYMKLKVSLWKMVFGSRSFPFGIVYFQGLLLLVSGKLTSLKKITPSILKPKKTSTSKSSSPSKNEGKPIGSMPGAGGFVAVGSQIRYLKERLNRRQKEVTFWVKGSSKMVSKKRYRSLLKEG